MDHLSERIVDGSVGPRVIAGDFNLLEEANPFRAHWESAGFVEIQQLWARRFGVPVQPTCKHRTRKDFVYVSPELLPWVTQVSVQDDWFADHALLQATLQLPGAAPARPFWRMPRPRKLPADIARSFPRVPPARCQQLAQETDPGRLYAAVWAEQEDLISHALVSRGLAPLTPAERGRGCTSDVQVARNCVAPARKPAKVKFSLFTLDSTSVMPIGSGSYVGSSPWCMLLAKLRLPLMPLRTGRLLGMRFVLRRVSSLPCLPGGLLVHTGCTMPPDACQVAYLV